ncbi:MAG TPA: hypothetical protein DCP25_03435 [Chloroflexi bacterium]|jgi:hypothetical protein|nr:hypothetical protein [Chloroflexota bacterium]
MLARLLLLACAVSALAVAPAAIASPQPHLFEQLIRDINQLAIGDPGLNPRPFLASAEASARANERGNDCAALGALGALENKLDAQLGGIGDPGIRPAMDDIAQIRAALVPPPDGDLPPGPC